MVLGGESGLGPRWRGGVKAWVSFAYIYLETLVGAPLG
jgi:hypothetical protein